jgi:hypothetical protein
LLRWYLCEFCDMKSIQVYRCPLCGRIACSDTNCSQCSRNPKLTNQSCIIETVYNADDRSACQCTSLDFIKAYVQLQTDHELLKYRIKQYTNEHIWLDRSQLNAIIGGS